MIAVLLKDKDYFDKVITSAEGEKIKNKNELKLQIISEFDEAEVNTPPETVPLDRTNGALRPLKWCMVTAVMVH